MERDEAKKIGSIFLVIGFLMATPPGILLPDDFINMVVAREIAPHLSVAYDEALLITYTLVAWGLILLGAWIYPYNTEALFSSKLHKIKSFIITSIDKNPILFFVSIYLFYIIFQWYNTYLGGMV